MTFGFDPPPLLLPLAIGIPLLAVAAVALGRRHPVRKILGLVVTAVIVATLLDRFFTIRSSSLTVDDDGIAGQVFGDPQITWPEVEQARYFADVGASAYRPARPDSMATMIGSLNARFGWYSLANGRHGLVALERLHGAGIVVTTPDATYVFGPADAAGFAEAIAAHVPVAGRGAGDP